MLLLAIVAFYTGLAEYDATTGVFVGLSVYLFFLLLIYFFLELRLRRGLSPIPVWNQRQGTIHSQENGDYLQLTSNVEENRELDNDDQGDGDDHGGDDDYDRRDGEVYDPLSGLTQEQG